MLEPTRSVESVELSGAAQDVEGAGGDRGVLGGVRPSAGDGRPDPELAERPKRRTFTAAYKLRIVTEAAGASRPGEIASLLRREGLYTSHLTSWRKQQDAGALAGLEPRKRGPAGPSAEQVQVRALQARLDRAEAELVTARRVIEVQEKLSALLEDVLAPKRASPSTLPRSGR
jgi:transposase